MKIIWYEEMKENLEKIIHETTGFLGYKLTENKVEILKDNLTIETFRQAEQGLFGPISPMGKEFFRKGIVGDWKNYFGGKTLLSWAQWISDHLEGTDIVIPKN